jgi:hypothetical protein
MRIALFEQPDLPIATPALEALLLGDRVGHIAEAVTMDQPGHAILAGEPRGRFRSMLLHAAQQLAGDPDIRRP